MQRWNKNFGVFAADCSCFLLNRIPTEANQGKTPYKFWNKKKPNLTHLRVWGCLVYIHQKINNKLEARGSEGIFLGYARQSQCYLVWINERLRRSRNCIFDEERFGRKSTEGVNDGEGETEFDLISPSFQRTSPERNDDANNDADTDANNDADTDANDDTDADVDENNDDDDYHDDPSEGVETSDQNNSDHDFSDANQSKGKAKSEYESKRRGIQTQWLNDLDQRETHSTRSGKVRESQNMVDSAFAILEMEEPTTYRQAMNSPESNDWENAIKKELTSLEQMKTFTLVMRPNGVNVIQSRWVFKIKRKSNGAVDKFKARLVAKGFTQKYGIDYHEIFAPVARHATLRMLLAILRMRCFMFLFMRKAKPASKTDEGE